MTTYRKPASLCLALSLLSGCANMMGMPNLNALKEPKISLAGLSMKGLNLMEPTFLVKLKVDNPNDLNLDLSGADVDLALNGQKVASGISRSPLTLVKQGTSNMKIEVKASTLGVLKQIMQLQANSGVNYAVNGHLNVLNWLGSLGKIPINLQGSVDKATLLHGVEGLGGLGGLLR